MTMRTVPWAGLGAGCLLALLAGCGAAPAPAGAASPGDCVREMAGHGREGRIEAYLDCFAGPLREELAQARAASGDAAFAALLRGRAAPVRGIAIYEEEARDANSARLRVEWVFDDRNEIQSFTLRQEGGRWKVVQMQEADYTKPEIAYGTEAF